MLVVVHHMCRVFAEVGTFADKVRRLEVVMCDVHSCSCHGNCRYGYVLEKEEQIDWHRLAADTSLVQAEVDEVLDMHDIVAGFVVCQGKCLAGAVAAKKSRRYCTWMVRDYCRSAQAWVEKVEYESG